MMLSTTSPKKQIPSSLILILVLALQGILRADEVAGKKPAIYTTAVFNFSEGSKALEGSGTSAGELMNAFLSAADGLVLVERAELDKVLSEQELSLTGNVASDNAVKAGKLTGAQILVTGRIFQAGKKTYAVAKVIGSETGRVYAATVNYGADDDLGEPIEKLAAKVARLVSEKGSALVPKVESNEEMVARLKTGLAAPLPKVYVNIPEQHLTKVVPDPACQTEILKLLKDCGFGITEDPLKSDVKITGEAFSEFATRKGKLVACRARAEIKIVSRMEGDLTSVDRVMVGAVDLAEEIAGKSALQEAGLRLAVRFVESYQK